MGFLPQQKPNNARGDAMSRIVTDIVSCENQIHPFFLNQKIDSLLKRSNIDKEKGISPVAVFRVLVTLVFTGKNLYRTREKIRSLTGWFHRDLPPFYGARWLLAWQNNLAFFK
jgi:hypothetical protein